MSFPDLMTTGQDDDVCLLLGTMWV